jgi:uncharacterized membrane protein YgcG
MDAYDLHEGRFIQEFLNGSAANGLSIAAGTVPAGKVWTVIQAAGYPSVAETQTVWFALVTKTTAIFPLTVPVSIALSAVITFPMLTEGMELKLYPGDTLRFYRSVATNGSSIQIWIRYIETDLPYYAYEEPLNKVIKSSKQHGSAYRSTGSISPGSKSEGHGKPGGGGSVPEPV